MQQQAYTGIENLEVMQDAVNYNRYLLDLVRKHAPAQGTIVDFGAGSGQFAAPLATLGFDITAVEPDELLRDSLARQGLKTAASISHLTNASVHYIYSLNVLEHIDDDVAALRELHAKLAPGGRLLIYVPAFPILYTSMDARVGHVRRYRRKTLFAAVSAAGFKVESVRHVDSIGFLATLAFKWLDDGSGTLNRKALRIYDRLAFPVSRALDLILQRLLGKNLLLMARK